MKPRNGVIALAVALSCFSTWCLGASIWSITAFYISIPGLGLFFVSTPFFLFILLKLNKARKDDESLTSITTPAAVIGVVAVLLGITLFPFSLTYTFSPYLLTHSDATIVRLGAVSSHTINIWVRAPPPIASATVLLLESQIKITSAFDPLKDNSLIFALDSLSPATTYSYEVIIPESESAPLTTITSTFKTLPLPGSDSQLRFAFGSCAMKSAHAGYDMIGFQAVKDMGADFMLFMGDLIYADVPFSGYGLGTDRELYRSHYRRTFTDVHMTEMGKSVPSFFQYDDHEVLNDVSDPEHPSFIPATDIWREYAGSSNFAHNFSNSENEFDNDEVFQPSFFSFEAGAACIFVLDGRGHREITDSKRLMLGEKQMSEVLAWLKASTSNRCKFQIMASSNPITPNYLHGEEGWRTFDDLQIIAKFIADNNVTGAFFMSGDSHQQGVYEVAPGLLEITSSPISAGGVPFRTIDGKISPIVWEQSDLGAQHSSQLAIVDITDGENPKLTVGLYSGADELYGWSKPRLLVEIFENLNNEKNASWELVGGTRMSTATSLSSVESSKFEGISIPVPERVPNSQAFIKLLFLSGGGLLVVLIVLTIAVCVVCCNCCNRKVKQVEEFS